MHTVHRRASGRKRVQQCMPVAPLGGVDVRSMEPRRLMEHVAFVFQTNRLFKQSVLENVRAARPDATREEVVRALSAAQCDDIIEKLPDGVDTVYGAAGAHFSGGEVQRAALAKVLLCEPRLLLLDEPTKGLDAFFKDKLARLLRSLTARGTTVLMVSHDVEFCASYADWCALFFDGNVVTTNPPRQFFASNSFYTTAANRISRGFFENVVTVEEVVELCRS